MKKHKQPFEMVIVDMVDNCGRTRTAIASDMGKPLSTLSRELSPYDDGAKLGVSDILPLSNACDSDAIIEWLANARGYRLVPLEAAPDGVDMNEAVNQAWEAAGIFLTKARNDTRSYLEPPRLRRRVAKEMDDVLARAQKELEGSK